MKFSPVNLFFWAWLAWHCKMACISLICFHSTNSKNQPNSTIMFHAWGGKSRWGNKAFCTYFMCLYLLLLLHIIWILLLRNNSNRKIVIKIVKKMFSILFGKMAYIHAWISVLKINSLFSRRHPGLPGMLYKK